MFVSEKDIQKYECYSAYHLFYTQVEACTQKAKRDEKSSVLFTFSLCEGLKTPLGGVWWNFAKRHSKIRVLVRTTYMSVDVMM